MTTLLTALEAAATVTASSAPLLGDINTYDATTGAISIPLPALAMLNIGSNLMVEKDSRDVSGNSMTINCAGSDTFYDGTTSVSLATPGEGRTLQVVSINGTRYWKIMSSSINSNTSVAGVGSALNGSAVITTATTPVMGNINRYNANGGGISNVLPLLSAVTVGTTLMIAKDTLDNNTNTVGFACSGADTFDDGTTSLTLTWAGQKRTLQVVSISGTKHWAIIDAYDPPAGLRAKTAYVAIGETTTSTSWTDLATTTDQVTVMVGTSGVVHLDTSAYIEVDDGNWANMAVAVSGANTIAPDTGLVEAFGPGHYTTAAGGSGTRMGVSAIVSGLNPGSTTFKLKYSVGGGTGIYNDRRISVTPL